MTFQFVGIVSTAFIVISSACRTIPMEQTQELKAQSVVATPNKEEKPVVPPSPAVKGTTDLVTPGADEVLNRRGPHARCPNAVELDTLERIVSSLGRETVDLVKEDLANLRQTATRSDSDGIASCCNQLEQLVQDAEIMNEDKQSAVASLDRIRKTTLQLCPPI